MKSYILCFTLMVAGVANTQADTSTVIPHLDLQAAFKQAADSLEVSVKKFTELTGIKTEFDKEKIQNFLKTTFGPTQEKIQEAINNLEKESGKHGEEFKKNLDSLVKQFNETVKQIGSGGDAQAKVQKLHEVFQQNLKKIVEQTGELGKSAGVNVPPSIQKNVNEVFEELSKFSGKLIEKTNKVIAEVQAESKKKSSS